MNFWVVIAFVYFGFFVSTIIASNSTLGMPLAVNGVQYYLYHVESNKYIHPQGGSDNPLDNTPLVYHSGYDNRLALRFIFINNQLKQYSSGKYVHPQGGTVVDNNTKLVLHEESFGDRTSIYMVSEEGITYLRHGDFYVHPQGGLINPLDNTPLVYHRGRRPGIGISILPAENCEIIEFNYDGNALSRLTGDPLIAISSREDNNSSATLTTTISATFSESVTNSFSYSFTETFGLKIGSTFTTKFLIAANTISIELNLEFSSTQTTVKTTTSGVAVTVSRTVEIPPFSCVKLQAFTQTRKGKVPYTAKFRTSTGFIFEMSGVLEAAYFFDQYSKVMNC